MFVIQVSTMYLFTDKYPDLLDNCLFQKCTDVHEHVLHHEIIQTCDRISEPERKYTTLEETLLIKSNRPKIDIMLPQYDTESSSDEDTIRMSTIPLLLPTLEYELSYSFEEYALPFADQIADSANTWTDPIQQPLTDIEYKFAQYSIQPLLPVYDSAAIGARNKTVNVSIDNHDDFNDNAEEKNEESDCSSDSTWSQPTLWDEHNLNSPNNVTTCIDSPSSATYAIQPTCIDASNSKYHHSRSQNNIDASYSCRNRTDDSAKWQSSDTVTFSESTRPSSKFTTDNKSKTVISIRSSSASCCGDLAADKQRTIVSVARHHANAQCRLVPIWEGSVQSPVVVVFVTNDVTSEDTYKKK